MASKIKLIIFTGVLAISYVIWGISISLVAPFYPTEAEKKGATPSQYGLVFGVNNLAGFIATPLIARYIPKIGGKIVILSGAFGISICLLSFGSLDYIQDTITFISLSYVIRFINGFSIAAAFNTGNGFLLQQFPDNPSSVVGASNMCQGIGYIIGAPLGSYLYVIGGFSMPFFIFGPLALLCSVALLVSVPDSSDDKSKGPSVGKAMTINDVVINPSIWLSYFDLILVCCGLGFVDSMLAPFMIRKFGASQMEIGMTLFIAGITFVSTSPLLGFVSI